jgi:hypothetical protein
MPPMFAYSVPYSKSHIGLTFAKGYSGSIRRIGWQNGRLHKVNRHKVLQKFQTQKCGYNWISFVVFKGFLRIWAGC